MTTVSTPLKAAPRSEVTVTESGNTTPGRYLAFSRVACICSARPASRVHSTTGLPWCPSSHDSVVPQAPAPIIAVFFSVSLLLVIVVGFGLGFLPNLGLAARKQAPDIRPVALDQNDRQNNSQHHIIA